jgi:hypothetical protein
MGWLTSDVNEDVTSRTLCTDVLSVGEKGSVESSSQSGNELQ